MVDIPMGENCAHFPADFFRYSYEPDILTEHSNSTNMKTMFCRERQNILKNRVSLLSINYKIENFRESLLDHTSNTERV